MAGVGFLGLHFEHRLKFRGSGQTVALVDRTLGTNAVPKSQLGLFLCIDCALKQLKLAPPHVSTHLLLSWLLNGPGSPSELLGTTRRLTAPSAIFWIGGGGWVHCIAKRPREACLSLLLRVGAGHSQGYPL